MRRLTILGSWVLCKASFRVAGVSLRAGRESGASSSGEIAGRSTLAGGGLEAARTSESAHNGGFSILVRPLLLGLADVSEEADEDPGDVSWSDSVLSLGSGDAAITDDDVEALIRQMEDEAAAATGVATGGGGGLSTSSASDDLVGAEGDGAAALQEPAPSTTSDSDSSDDWVDPLGDLALTNEEAASLIRTVHAGVLDDQRRSAERIMRRGDFLVSVEAAGAGSAARSASSTDCREREDRTRREGQSSPNSRADSSSEGSEDIRAGGSGSHHAQGSGGDLASCDDAGAEVFGRAITVGDLKRLIEREVDIAKARQRLLYLGKELADESTLRECRIGPDAVVFLMLRKIPTAPIKFSVASMAGAKVALGGAGGRGPARRSDANAGASTSTGVEEDKTELEMGADRTVADVKREVQMQSGIWAGNQVLVFRGKKLTDDDMALCECGIVSGSTVYLVLKRPRNTRIYVRSPLLAAGGGGARRIADGRQDPGRAGGGGHHDDRIGVDVNLEDYVGELKVQLERLVGVNGEKQVLMYGAGGGANGGAMWATLEDMHTLGESGIRAGSTLHLALNMKASRRNALP